MANYRTGFGQIEECCVIASSKRGSNFSVAVAAASNIGVLIAELLASSNNLAHNCPELKY